MRVWVSVSVRACLYGEHDQTNTLTYTQHWCVCVCVCVCDCLLVYVLASGRFISVRFVLLRVMPFRLIARLLFLLCGSKTIYDIIQITGGDRLCNTMHSHHAQSSTHVALDELTPAMQQMVGAAAAARHRDNLIVPLFSNAGRRPVRAEPAVS